MNYFRRSQVVLWVFIVAMLSGCAAPLLYAVAPGMLSDSASSGGGENDAARGGTASTEPAIDPGIYGGMSCEALKYEFQSERAETQSASSTKLAQIERAASNISCDVSAARTSPGVYGKMNCKSLRSNYAKLQTQAKSPKTNTTIAADKAIRSKLMQIESAASEKKCALEG